jgi:hypothetical protein
MARPYQMLGRARALAERRLQQPLNTPLELPDMLQALAAYRTAGPDMVTPSPEATASSYLRRCISGVENAAGNAV